MSQSLKSYRLNPPITTFTTVTKRQETDFVKLWRFSLCFERNPTAICKLFRRISIGRKGILHDFVTTACHIVWLASSGASVIWEQGEKRREEKRRAEFVLV